MTAKLSRNDYISRQFDELARMHRESITFQTNKYASLWGVIGIALDAALLKDFSGIPYCASFLYVVNNDTLRIRHYQGRDQIFPIAWIYTRSIGCN